MSALKTTENGQSGNEISLGMGFGSMASFEFTQRVAKMLSSSSIVPITYRSVDKNGVENPNGIANCVVALNIATRLNIDPLAVMQNLHVIEGRPSWSSSYVIARINECGRFSTLLRFDMTDLGEKEVEYQIIEWKNREKTTKKVSEKVRNIKCVAWTIEKATGERIDGPEVSMELAVKEGWYGKNGSKWQTMPEVMLRYRAASFFGKFNIPDLLMGLQTKEELEDIIDINQPPLSPITNKRTKTVITEGSIIETKPNEPIELPAYTDEQLSKNLPVWKEAIADQKMTPYDIVAKITSRYDLLPEQAKQIYDLKVVEPEQTTKLIEKEIDSFVAEMNEAEQKQS